MRKLKRAPRSLRSNRNSSKKSSSNKVSWIKAKDIGVRVRKLVQDLELDWIDVKNVHFVRSKYSKTRALARIWGLSRIWQLALKTKPSYIIEVISEKFDRLNPKAQDEVLIHELTHIPKNFSGSLLPHVRKKGKRHFETRVRTLVKKL